MIYVNIATTILYCFNMCSIEKLKQYIKIIQHRSTSTTKTIINIIQITLTYNVWYKNIAKCYQMICLTKNVCYQVNNCMPSLLDLLGQDNHAIFGTFNEAS